MVLVEIGDLGVRFWSIFLDGKGVESTVIALECIQVASRTLLHFCKLFWGLKLRKMGFFGKKTAFCPC